MMDDNFRVPTFKPHPDEQDYSCFPEVYEGGPEEMQALLDKGFKMASAPSSSRK